MGIASTVIRPRRNFLVVAIAVLTAACSTTPPAQIAASPMNNAGLERVMGKTRDALVPLFGAPDLDIREGTARKLQFANSVCVLDTYLYPASVGGTPMVTYIEARTPQGDDFDRASCIAALVRSTPNR